MNIRTAMGWAGAIAAAGIAAPAEAGVTYYSTRDDFTAAAAPLTVETFEGLTPGSKGGSLTTSGITITSLAGATAQHDVYITPAGQLTNTVQFASQSLSANGDENFQFQLAGGGGFHAIGFDLITNYYASQTLYLYSAANALIDKMSVPIGANQQGFFGAISTAPIAYARFFDTYGYVQDEGIDNLSIDTGATATGAVPEPASWAMLLLGFGGLGRALRRRGDMRVRFA